MLLVSKRWPSRLHTRTRPCAIWTLIPDSSVKSTPDHCFHVRFVCYCPQYIRAILWCLVNGTPTKGQLSRTLIARRRFSMGKDQVIATCTAYKSKYFLCWHAPTEKTSSWLIFAKPFIFCDVCQIPEACAYNRFTTNVNHTLLQESS